MLVVNGVVDVAVAVVVVVVVVVGGGGGCCCLRLKQLSERLNVVEQQLPSTLFEGNG